MAAEEAQRLNDCHDGEYYSYGSSCAGADPAYKKGISHVIKDETSMLIIVGTASRPIRPGIGASVIMIYFWSGE